MKPAFVLLLFLTGCGTMPARANVATLGAAQDTSIFQNNVNNSDGGGPGIFAGTSGTGSPRRALISFDVSGIPAGAIVTSVQLALTLGQTAASGPGSATIGLFAVTQNWSQGTNGSTSTGIGGTGQGYAANAGDATWNAAFYSATAPTLWNTPGGDHASSASASLLLSGTTLGTAYTWVSTGRLVANVQGWVNNSATNFGLELINADETDASTLYGFYSSEWDNAHFGGSASQVPALQVTYTLPEPADGSLTAVAVLTLLGLCRSRCRLPPVLDQMHRVAESRAVLTEMNRRRDAFTLVELLVVIAIIAMIAALTASVYGRAQAGRNQVESAARLRQWGVALGSYVAANDSDLPRRGQGVQPVTQLNRPEDWFNALPPYLGQPGYGQLLGTGQRPKAGAHSIFVRPGARDPGGTAFLSYGMNMNLSPWNLPAPTKLARIEQPALTVFLAESPGAYASTYPSARPYGCVADYNGRGNVLFLDGHVGVFDANYIGVGKGDPQRDDVRWLTGTESDAQAPNY